MDNADQTVSASEAILRAASRRRRPEAPAPPPPDDSKVTFVIEDGPRALLDKFATRFTRGADGKYRTAVVRDRVEEVERYLHAQGASYYLMDAEKLLLHSNFPTDARLPPPLPEGAELPRRRGRKGVVPIEPTEPNLIAATAAALVAQATAAPVSEPAPAPKRRGRPAKATAAVPAKAPVAMDRNIDKILAASGLVNAVKIAMVRSALEAHFAGTTPIAEGLAAWAAECATRGWTCRPSLCKRIASLVA